MPKPNANVSKPVLSSSHDRVVTDGPFAETKESFAAHGVAKPGCYARVNGLRMYYEIHGAGRPLVLLHGAFATIDCTFGSVLKQFATTRRVIAIEQQAHGRTSDIDRALSYEQMANDTAELLRKLDVRQADFFGFSMGATVALSLAVQHPGLARKVAVVSGGYGVDAYAPSMLARFRRSKVPDLAERRTDDPIYRLLQSSAMLAGPLTTKRVGELRDGFDALRLDDLRSVRAHALVVGTERGLIRPEHSLTMSALVRYAQLRILAGDDHDPSIIGRSASLLPAFLDAPSPVAA